MSDRADNEIQVPQSFSAVHRAAITRTLCLISLLEAWRKWSGAETSIYLVNKTYQWKRMV